MSKTLQKFLVSFAAGAAVALSIYEVGAQDLEATIKIDGKVANRVRIEGRFLADRSGPANFLYLMSEYAGAKGLLERVSDVRAFDSKGVNLTLTKLGDSYIAEGDIISWAYTVNLAPIRQTVAASRVSWILPEGGILMLDDLMPQEPLADGLDKRPARIKFDLPASWKILSTHRSENEIDSIEKAVFVIGRNWRERDLVVGGTSIKLLLSGEWSFSDDDLVATTDEILAHYLKLFGGAPQKNFQMTLYRFPFPVAAGEWEGDTRGSSITIASSDMPFKSQSLQRLHEQLRHEIFHLWLPNGVNLPGDYAWFYEGFALYQSLKLGVAVNRIRFEDMLDTLSRAHNIDSAKKDRVSLLLAPGSGWRAAYTHIYTRGMLIAFLCDLMFLSGSDGGSSTDDFLRQFYSEFRGPNRHVDGYAAVTGSLYRNKNKDLRTIVDRYIGEDEPIDWGDLLRVAGLEAKKTVSGIELKPVANPTGGQKKLLDKLGYNNWRKLSKGNK